MHKIPHMIPPHKCEMIDLKIKSDLKPYFECDHVENLWENSFQQAQDDAPTDGHDREHANELPNPTYA